MEIGVKHFNYYFWFLKVNLDLPFMDRLNEITKGFRMPKFDDSGFYASPIQQYPLELIIVAVSVFLYMIQSLITEKGSTS